MENVHGRARRMHTDPYHYYLSSPVHLLSSIILVLVLATMSSGCRPSQSEKHTLLINGMVHVYPTDTPPAAYPGSNFIAVVGPQDKTDVKQIVHKSNYVAVRIKLSDGREGWVFSGENIELR